MSDEPSRPAWLTVNLAAVRENVRSVCRWIGPGARYLAVVKANAYGHGLIPCARAALEGGAWGLAVAIVEEGVSLREGGITAPVLVMGACDPRSADELARHDLEAALATPEMLSALSAAAVALGRPVRVHVKVDTGMGRVGVSPDECADFLRRVRAAPGLQWVGLMTHFATAEDRASEIVRHQWRRFLAVLDTARAARERSAPPLMVHAANSAAVCRMEETVAAVPGAIPAVRAGLLTYGIPPVDGGPALDLRPALRLKARVTQARTVPAGTTVSYGATFTTKRESRLALVPLGYADGYSRACSNRAMCLLRGRRAPVAGRVCMDQLVLDATGTGAEVGDEVTLIGPQGGDEITVNELAAWADTVHHEVLARLGARLPRRYVDALDPE